MSYEPGGGNGNNDPTAKIYAAYDEFPATPQGSVSCANTVARDLKAAAASWQDVRGNLDAAIAATDIDWKGDASQHYRAAAQKLASVSYTAGDTFADCAAAVAGFASALDDVQGELKRLRTAYDTATGAAGAAAKDYNEANAKLSSHPDASDHLTKVMSKAQSAMQNSESDANSYVAQANTAIKNYHDRVQGYTKTLNQPSQKGGNGFGVPVKLLTKNDNGQALYNWFQKFDGQYHLPKDGGYDKQVPAWGLWYDGNHSATSPGDLTDLITFLVAPGEGALKDLSVDALKSLAKDLGIKSVEDLTTAEGRKAIETQILNTLKEEGSYQIVKLKVLMKLAAESTSETAANLLENADVRVHALDAVVSAAGHVGLHVPPDAVTAMEELVGENAETYRNSAIQAIDKWNAWVGAHASPEVAKQVGTLISKFLSVVAK